MIIAASKATTSSVVDVSYVSVHAATSFALDALDANDVFDASLETFVQQVVVSVPVMSRLV